jgi:hypothetical protein
MFPELQSIDAGLAAKIQQAKPELGAVPSQVCNNCFTELAGSIARGSLLAARDKAKEQKKLMLWKSRVNLIKKARQLMNEKAFSEAAVQYEKYIKVLEMVFDCEAGELTPEHFKDHARTQELTVVAGVYWDLMRIYDTSEKYGERMQQAGAKLAQFLRFTPVFPDIIRKAESFSKSAKNPQVVKQFLKQASEARGRCFIATSAFGSLDAPEVVDFRAYRDLVLENSAAGRFFIRAYYRFSPKFAAFLDRSPILRGLVRGILRLIHHAVRRSL